jgi:tetratricopeptide (TPR) repeat protein
MPVDPGVAKVAESSAFRSALRDLYEAAGKPSARSISRDLADVSHTTVADLLNGRRIPSWAIARRVIAFLGGDEASFKQLWDIDADTPGAAGPDGGAGIFPASTALSLPRSLPRDVPLFTGRDDELARLAALAEGGRVVVTAIGGSAGIGKTALALHAAHQLLPQFPDGQLYADLHGYAPGQSPLEPGEALWVFLRQLGMPAEVIPADTEERAAMLRGAIASRRVLVVLDNAVSEAQVRPLLPGAGQSLVLVTSRSLLPGLEVDERISLDVLPPDQAAALLGGIIGEKRAAAEPEAVASLVRECGGLPLALRIVGQSLAAHPAWPVSRMALMLSDESRLLDSLSAGDVHVRAVFSTSYRQLAHEDARVFRFLGLHPGPDFDVESAAALVGVDVRAASSALDRLTEAYLVIEDGQGRYGMHDLLRLYARETSTENDALSARDAAEERLVRHYADLAEYLDASLNPGRSSATAQHGEPPSSPQEVLATFQTERPSLMAIATLASRRGMDELLLRLSMSMSTALTLLRRLDDLLDIREAAVRAARHTGDRHMESRAVDNLGVAYERLGRLEEAIGCFEQSLSTSREIGDVRGEGVTLANLGTVYGRLGRLDEAVDCLQKSLTLFQEVGDRYMEGLVHSELGAAYASTRRLEDALGCYERAVAIFRQIGDRYGEGLALEHIGTAFRDLGQLEHAVASLTESSAAMRDVGELDEADRIRRLAESAAVHGRRSSGA